MPTRLLAVFKRDECRQQLKLSIDPPPADNIIVGQRVEDRPIPAGNDWYINVCLKLRIVRAKWGSSKGGVPQWLMPGQVGWAEVKVAHLTEGEKMLGERGLCYYNQNSPFSAISMTPSWPTPGWGQDNYAWASPWCWPKEYNNSNKLAAIGGMDCREILRKTETRRLIPGWR